MPQNIHFIHNSVTHNYENDILIGTSLYISRVVDASTPSSDHCVSTSKIHNKFHEAPKNMKRLGLDANSICFSKNNLLKIISRSLPSPN